MAFLNAGFTHEDNDREFSRSSGHLRRSNAVNLPELHKSFTGKQWFKACFAQAASNYLARLLQPPKSQRQFRVFPTIYDFQIWGIVIGFDFAAITTSWIVKGRGRSYLKLWQESQEKHYVWESCEAFQSYKKHLTNWSELSSWCWRKWTQGCHRRKSS